MALPDLNNFCNPPAPQTCAPLCITFPGGAQFCGVGGTTPPDSLSFAASAVAQATVALAPLQPVFDVINVLVDLVACVKAIPGILGPPPNPGKLIACFPKLVDDLAKLLGILPPLSVPVLIASILEAILCFLEGLRAVIMSILNKLIRILAALLRVKVTGSLALQVAVDCEQQNLDGFLAWISTLVEPITCLLTLINALLGLIGLPELNITLSVGVDVSALEAILTPIDDIIAILKALLASLPVGGSC
jgi:hypothetical protein